MNNFNISILIPTYNRAVYLKEALASIVSQIGDGEKIECIVSDNASSDNTKEIVMDFQKKYDFIRYYRNETNIGPDRNILLCLNYAQGEYVWWFGDDDRMQPGAIESVKAVLNKYKDLSLVYINYSVNSLDFKVLIKPRGVRQFNDRLFHTASDCLKTIGFHLSFMSSSLFQRKLCLLVQREDDFIDSKWTPFYRALSVLGAANKPSFFISHPYIAERSGNSGEDDFFGCFIGGACRILEAVKPLGYENASIRKTKNDIIKLALFRKVANLRRTAPQELKGTLSLLIKHFHNYPFFWIYVFPLYVIPVFFIRFLYGVYKIKNIV
jgi:abequosyltransferase